jgi:uncharacterized repeat protein (TIGR03803 family)
MRNPGFSTIASVVIAFCVATAIASQAQNLTTLVNFDGFNGGDPALANLIQGTDGNLYGPTQGNGVPHTKGTIFRITPAGKLTTLYRFCSQPNCGDGWLPTGVVQAEDLSLYGVAEFGGVTTGNCGVVGCGTVFKLSPQGKYAVLYSFCSETNCSDGSFPGKPWFRPATGTFTEPPFAAAWALHRKTATRVPARFSKSLPRGS